MFCYKIHRKACIKISIEGLKVFKSAPVYHPSDMEAIRVGGYVQNFLFLTKILAQNSSLDARNQSSLGKCLLFLHIGHHYSEIIAACYKVSLFEIKADIRDTAIVRLPEFFYLAKLCR